MLCRVRQRHHLRPKRDVFKCLLIEGNFRALLVISHSPHIRKQDVIEGRSFFVEALEIIECTFLRSVFRLNVSNPLEISHFQRISMKQSADFIKKLLVVSEKAARLSRSCRQNEHLHCLLVQEKQNDEKNARFVKDFKTLADVLVQEMIKYDLENEFPDLKNSIHGEENNTFTNTLGESVTVILTESKSNTALLLQEVLNGDTKAAHLMAETIHDAVSIDDVPVQILPDDGPNLDFKELALWIDPIDSTAEYISGGNNISEDIPLSGLKCVTVLIGVFNKQTGVPIIGVINQPFFTFSDNKWTGRALWGISVNEFYKSSIPLVISSMRSEPLVAISVSENDQNKKKLEDAGFKLISPAGAGHKILCVILGLVDAYVLSQSSTYFWDTCGSHAILKSMNGNIWNYEQSLSNELVELLYSEKKEGQDVKQYRNKFGFIACKDRSLTLKIISTLQ